MSSTGAEPSRGEAMDQQSLIHAFVARGTVVLAQYTEVTGNFTTIVAQFLQKLPASNNKFTYDTYNCDGHTFNYLVEDGFTYCVVAIESVGPQIPRAFLDRVMEDFTKKYGGGKNATTVTANSLNREFGKSKLKEHMQYCVDHTEEISKLAKVKAQVSVNIAKVLDRGEKIELLADKTENLCSQVPGMAKMLEDLCDYYKLPHSLILLGVPPPGDDMMRLVSTVAEAMSMSETMKADMGMGKAVEKTIAIHCANFMAPSCAAAIELQLSWLMEKKETSDLGHEPQVLVQNPSLLREKKKATSTLEKLMARFAALAGLVAQQVQDLETQFQKAHSLQESYSEIGQIGRRSAHIVERLQEIKGSALEAFVITGFSGSALTAEAAYIIRHHFHEEVEQMSDEDIGNFMVGFLGSIVDDADTLMNEDGSLQEGITLDELRQHVLYVLGRTHMENVVLQCCREVSKTLRQNMDGILIDAQASETIRAQATTLADLLQKPTLIGCHSTISVDLTYKAYDGSSDDSGDDLGDHEEAQEEEEGWEDSSDDDSATSNRGYEVHETVSQSQASVSTHSNNAPNDVGSEEAAAEDIGNKGVSSRNEGSMKKSVMYGKTYTRRGKQDG